MPITEHSTSMPAEKPSTITSESWAKAASSAGPSSASDQTLAIPTEEPSRAGLTNTGRAEHGQLAQDGLGLGLPARQAHARVGRPAGRRRRPAPP